LLSHASSSTSLRPHQAEIEGDHEEYVVDFISDGKTDNWPRRSGPYLLFLTHFVSFDIPEWLLLEQVDDCEQLSIFMAPPPHPCICIVCGAGDVTETRLNLGTTPASPSYQSGGGASRVFTRGKSPLWKNMRRACSHPGLPFRIKGLPTHLRACKKALPSTEIKWLHTL